ncbi:MAG TPA: hypothetical protein VOA87_21410 [Thermoanaerobaculia bacterium]|nr:hypothetical protein [Thermoanaerobaculia bacterium]
MSLRPHTARLAGSRRGRAGGKGHWSFWGDGAGIDHLHKLVSTFVTLSTFVFGIWVYYNSVRPVFEKQAELRAERQRVKQLDSEIKNLKQERTALQQGLERFQNAATTHRRAIVLAHLMQLRSELRRDAALYRQQGLGAFDLRVYALAKVDASLKRLGPAPSDSAASYQKEALEFLRSFIDRTIPQHATDERWLDPLLDAYDRQQRTAAP